MNPKVTPVEEKKDYTFAIFVITILLAIVPLIVHIKPVILSDTEKLIFGDQQGTGVYNDVFSYYKSIIILIFSGIVLTYSVVMAFIGTGFGKLTFYKNPVVIFAGVYIVFTLLSSFTSDYQHTVTNGVYQRYESVWVLLSYIVIFLSTLYYTKNKRALSFLLYGVYFSAFVVGIIGLFQFFGHDPFNTKAMTKIILGSYYTPESSLEIHFDFIYSTLYNPNCVGFYTSMLFPISLILGLYLPKNSKFKYVSLLLSVIMLFNLIGCRSRGGLVGAGGTLIVLAICFFVRSIYLKQVKSVIKIGAIGLVSMVILVGAILALSGSESRTTFVDRVKSIFVFGDKSETYFKDYIADPQGIHVVTANGTLTINKVGADFIVSHSALGVATPATSTQDEYGSPVYTYSIANYGDVTLRVVSGIYAIVNVPGSASPLLMAFEDGKLPTPITPAGEPIDITKGVDSIGFENMQNYGSNRGYIWSRTFPIILKNFFIGSGPDTYAFEFPQNDYLGKLKNFSDPLIVVDKAHNAYLQTAVTTGAISAIAILIIFLIYVVQGFMLIIRTQISKDKFWFAALFGLYAGNIGYMVSAFATDSEVSVSPVFWALLGMGFAVNALAKTGFASVETLVKKKR